MRDPATTSLRDVYTALGESMLSGAGSVGSPGCLVEQAIAGLMKDFRSRAEALLMELLGKSTLADISAAVRRLMEKHKGRRMLHVA